LSSTWGRYLYPSRTARQRRPQSGPASRSGAFDERVRLFEELDQDGLALVADIPDLLRFMLATGQRIGECLGVLWFEIDLQAGRVDVSSTVIRWTGHGLVRKSTKSKAGERSLLIPSWMVTELQKRFSRGVRMDEPVFANSLGGFRDPKNTRRDVRHALDRADFSWVTSHNFRKTTATLPDQAGLSARVIADQLGHARPSMTQDVYMGRKLVDGRAVEALEEAFGRAKLSGNSEPQEGKDVG